MSADPQQMQQMLAMYKALYPGGVPNQQAPQLQGFNTLQQNLGKGAPMGTNRTAGGVNAASQLMIALLKAQKMKQLQQQVQQQPASPTPAQGITSGGAVDGSSAPQGMMGPP